MVSSRILSDSFPLLLLFDSFIFSSTRVVVLFHINFWNIPIIMHC